MADRRQLKDIAEHAEVLRRFHLEVLPKMREAAKRVSRRKATLCMSRRAANASRPSMGGAAPRLAAQAAAARTQVPTVEQRAAERSQSSLGARAKVGQTRGLLIFTSLRCVAHGQSPHTACADRSPSGRSYGGGSRGSHARTLPAIVKESPQKRRAAFVFFCSELKGNFQHSH